MNQKQKNAKSGQDGKNTRLFFRIDAVPFFAPEKMSYFLRFRLDEPIKDEPMGAKKSYLVCHGKLPVWITPTVVDSNLTERYVITYNFRYNGKKNTGGNKHNTATLESTDFPVRVFNACWHFVHALVLSHVIKVAKPILCAGKEPIKFLNTTSGMVPVLSGGAGLFFTQKVSTKKHLAEVQKILLGGEALYKKVTKKERKAGVVAGCETNVMASVPASSGKLTNAITGAIVEIGSTAKNPGEENIVLKIIKRIRINLAL